MANNGTARHSSNSSNRRGNRTGNNSTRAGDDQPNAWRVSSNKKGKNQSNNKGNIRGSGLSSKEQREVSVSKKTLERVETIKQSSVAHLSTTEGHSSSSDDDNDMVGKELLENTLKKYYMSLATVSNDADERDKQSMVKSPQFLSGSFLAANSSCLICICSIRRNHPVWSCNNCYCVFHLQCIHQWVVEGVQRKTSLSPQLFPGQEQTWSCPKCRGEYNQSQCPQKYLCYCGKVEDPPVDPWLIPHSCGDSCDKPLVPECGHHCLSLCHPGLCPPCPKNVSVKCYCGRSQPTMRRCGSKGWSCGGICRKPLACGQHICEEKCHEGPCPTCTYTLEQPCQCGRVTKERLCTELDWSCEQKCHKKFQCGHHSCERVCHTGDCGACPRTGERACPCGRTKHVLLCTKDVPTCGDTCGKVLACGLHNCMRTCHNGNCGNCLEQVIKKCRCGSKNKSLTCGTEFYCDVKCTNIKRCGRHPCKRKCCDGNCPPCELVCGKQLQCGRHKCTALCHTGRCYPCVLMTTLSCSCGKTKIQVLCEQRHKARLRKCQELCMTPPTCHHPLRTPHLCHLKECPPCEQKCCKSLDCSHICPVLCHSEPKHRPKEDAPMDATKPWAQMKILLQEYSEQVIITPCPPCMFPVQRACIGEHEINNFPCSRLRDYTCNRICGRILACGNHVCQDSCHKVIDAPNHIKAGSNCTQCDLLCERERPNGCTHKCHLPCHPEVCSKCEIYLRFRCHCATMPLLIKCHEWTSANDVEKLQLRACNSQCTKILSCGHRCSLSCHSGKCSLVNDCINELTLYCSCKRVKKQVKCNVSIEQKPVCDNECLRIKEEKRKERERLKAEEALEAERKQIEERNAFKRQLEGGKRRKKKTKETVKEEKEIGYFDKLNKKYLIIGISTTLALLTAIVAIVIINI